MIATLSDESLKAIKNTTPKQALNDIRDAVDEFGHEDGEQEREVSAPLITPEQRRKLELKLHRMLVWVGVLTPFEFELGGKIVPLHDIVWDLLAKDCLSDDEKEYVTKLVYKLQAHEKIDEEVLHNNRLTMDEAEDIFHEASGLLRAILSLKTLVGQKNVCTIRRSTNQRRLEDANYWLSFLRQIT